ncbi:DUF6065 family protein [Sphingomonas prati]|uniref:JmjC domain-containing protein n=1 Tax=Sphingomonas prati TaxID=1843237 RepID=A0A7W9BSQ1_9SPHN|nr:DUF6065 family protein [Sphingomonas prati]MBB5729234.1 hypothetical protein [Sphingomonas prati]GGE84090.1 hypothetical protein GCM10011404_15950 [Sphingomonas prati]
MELTFYTYPGWNPRIRAASHKREWMDASSEQFAYRCLPLAMANSHGWEILSPCGFKARWNGRPGPDGVEVVLDPGSDAGTAPVSLFGAGTVTFHVEALVQTAPGWNIWLGGSPNAAKDGIAPLGGLIETDWSPYSFTMNWRFTRADHWVRFEEGEPFCFLFPVERKAILDVQPVIRPIDEAPELKAAFEKWSESRNAFHAWVKETNPVAPSDKWQKLYYRGVNPDGSPGPADHASKLRLPQPQVGTGTVVTGAAAVCPMGGTGVREAAHEAAPAPAVLGSVITAMRAGAGTEAETVASTEPVADVVTADVALKRREWILNQMETQRALSPVAAGIPRVQGLTSDEFLDHFYAPSRPVVMTGAMDHWPARHWTPETLALKVGAREIEYQGGRTDAADYELYKDNHTRRMPFDRFIREVTGANQGNDAYITAYNSAVNREALQPLQADLGRFDTLLTDAPGMMWIGPLGTFTPLHFDLTNNLLAQVTGAKRILLLPPSETGKLYNSKHVFSDVHDIADEAMLARYPLARDARVFEVDLMAGELLYIPVGWWHQVTSLDFSVMLTYTNFIWTNDPYRSFPG